MRDKRDYKVKMFPSPPALLIPHLPHQNLFLKRLYHSYFRSGQICLNCELEVWGQRRGIIGKNLLILLFSSLVRGSGSLMNKRKEH